MAIIIQWIEFDERAMKPDEFRKYLDAYFEDCDYIKSWGDVSTDFVRQALETVEKLAQDKLEHPISLTKEELKMLRRLIKLFKEAK